jgi:ABC-2 type transport system ATP-binding protein
MNAMDLETTMRGLYMEWSPNRYSYMLDMLGVEKLRKIKNMEKPERVKLNLAAAMSHGTKLLIIDDILNDLDTSSIKSIVKALRAFVYDDGGSLFISSRVLGDFEDICDYFAFMRNGKLEFFDLKENLMQQYASIEKKVDLDEIMLYINKKARHSAKGNMKNRNLKKKKGKK